MNPAADGMPMIPLDQGLGIIGIGVVKGTRAVEAASKEAIVIGETAKRVAKYANKIGVKYYVPRKEIKAIGIVKAMKNNYQWLYNKVKQGYKIIDIGLDTDRTVRGIFYKAEKKWLQLWEK